MSEHDARRNTPMNSTIMEKLDERLEIVKYLYQHGASIDHYDRDGLTPFMYACSSGNAPLVEYLLNEQTDQRERLLHERSKTGESSLMYAIESGNVDIVRLLCEHGAHREEQKSPSYVTAAAFYGHAEILAKLIELGADVNEFGA